MSPTTPSDVVRRMMLALGRGDVDAFLATLAEDAEWHGGGVLLPVGTWRGRAAVRQGLEKNAALHGHVRRVVLREVAEEGHAVLLLGTIEFDGAHAARMVPNSWVFHLRGERVQRVTAYVSDAAARAAWPGRATGS